MKDLMIIAQENALTVFSDKGNLKPCLDKIRMVVSEFEPDLSTEGGRKEIASIANKVAKVKVFLDGVGKELVSEWKAKSKLVDVSRKYVRDELDALKIIARKPLTLWEFDEEEKARVEAERIEVERLAKERDSDHELGLFMNDRFDSDKKEALRMKRDYEARIEDERLEAEKTKAEDERIEREKRDKKIAEQAKKDAEADVEREKQAKLEAKKQVIREQERAKIERENAEKARIEAKKQAVIDAEQARADAIEAEKRRVADEAEKARFAQEKLEENKRHVGKIMKAAKLSLMSVCQLSEEQAKPVVLAIGRKLITNVELRY